MKTIKKFFLSFFAIALVSILLSSCFTATTTSIEIKQMPSTTFEVGTTEVEKLMIVKVTDSGVTNEVVLSIRAGQVVSSNESFNLVLEGFDLSSPGSFTASVKYGELVSYFDYQVLATTSLFAGGDGSSKNPYQITTSEQFTNLNSIKTKGNYFKIMNDISFDGAATVEVPDWTTCYVKEFSGVLEGNNKRLYNVSNCLIAQLSAATINNVEIIQNESTIFCTAVGRTYLNNVDIYGNITSDNNASPYIGYPGIKILNFTTGSYTTSYSAYTYLTLTDCDNHTDIIGQGDKVSAFFGFTYYGLKELVMKNCNNYGHIEADKVGFVTCNTFNASAIKLTMENCNNYGTFIQIDNTAGTNSVFAANSNVNNVPALSSSELNASKEYVNILYPSTVDSVDNSYYASIKNVDGKYVISKNSETTAQYEVAYVVVSLIVPIKCETSTNRPSATSAKLYFNEEGNIDLGILSTAYSYENGAARGNKVFEGVDWLYVDGETLIFVSEAYSHYSVFELSTTEKPYFVVYAYNSNNELVAGSLKVSLK